MKAHLTAALALASAAPALAQNVNWAEFVRDDSRLVASNELGLGDTEEKDYAWADFDKDGYIDLVCVRKQPFTSSGRRLNVLFMNEGGTLQDRTALYATNTDVPGDNGFMTPTNDRDVAIGDLDGDGWLDFVTATTLSPGQSKAVSHPRAYMNLGEVGGVWQGFQYQEARMPDFGTFPNMCGVAIGDVTGDGAADIYFSHYIAAASVDLNDRLLINDGNGFFTDESAARMTLNMRNSAFGTSADIGDMNGDGVNDVISASGLGTNSGATRASVAYNDPNNEGFFNLLQEPYSGAPYHSGIGDLNKDGKLDMVVSDDGSDRYLLNEGNDVFGRVDWSAALTFNTDDGFGSNNLIVDLDGDGWDEVIICDVDVDIEGCGRRLHVFHNRGGTVGGNVNIDEESGGGNFGAVGLPQLQGTHDIAVFDIDNDGDRDLVIGRCTDTRVYMNQRDQMGEDYCSPANANSTGVGADIRAIGSPVADANDVTLVCSDMPASAFGFFLVSRERGFIANPGGSQGNLCLGANIGRYVGPGQILDSGSGGTFSLAINTQAIPQPTMSVPAMAGDTFNFTTWFRDSVVGVATSNFSDAVAVTFR